MTTPPSARRLIVLALALSMAAAVSLGITRFAYGLLLPPMREDLQWSYLLAGAMNTVNAAGYLIGALATPALMRRFGPARLMLAGAVLASLFMALCGFFVAAGPLLLQRLLAGVASAFVFISGGLLAARLGAQDPRRAGLLLGLYYGGTGWGIVLSAWLVPALLEGMRDRPHGWAWAWWALGAACAVATLVLVWPARVLPGLALTAGQAAGSLAAGERRFRWADFGFGMAGYGMFGVGYIGYMTFVVALLREQGLGHAPVSLFYGLLGVAVLASSRIWAGLLDGYRGGQPQALLNLLLGVATVLPVLSTAWPALLVSGMLFGAVFLSVVASTTALVRHNLPASAWATGISAFTVVFAAGQIIGPTIVGWVADGPGGLARGLLWSACALWCGAALAWRQRALA